MARIGLKYPVVAEILSESPTGTPTYDVGFRIGHAVEANVSVEATDAELWADDELVESDQSFGGGTIEMNVDHISDLAYAKMTGHEIVNENGVTVVRARVTDTSPYFGTGYVRVLKKAGVRKYRAMWLYKTQYAEPADEGATKGKNVEFGTESIPGKIMGLSNGMWKDRATFASELDAKAWLDSKAGLIGEVDKTDLVAKITEIENLDPAGYVSGSWGPMYMSLQLAKAVNANADATQTQVDAALADLNAKQAGLVEV